MVYASLWSSRRYEQVPSAIHDSGASFSLLFATAIELTLIIEQDKTAIHQPTPLPTRRPIFLQTRSRKLRFMVTRTASGDPCTITWGLRYLAKRHFPEASDSPVLGGTVLRDTTFDRKISPPAATRPGLLRRSEITRKRGVEPCGGVDPAETAFAGRVGVFTFVCAPSRPVCDSAGSSPGESNIASRSGSASITGSGFAGGDR